MNDTSVHASLVWLFWNNLIKCMVYGSYSEVRMQVLFIYICMGMERLCLLINRLEMKRDIGPCPQAYSFNPHLPMISFIREIMI